MISKNVCAAIIAALTVSAFCQQTDPQKFIEKLEKLRTEKAKQAKSISLTVRIIREGKMSDNCFNERWSVMISPAKLETEKDKEAGQKFLVTLLTEKGKPDIEYSCDGKKMVMIDYGKKQYSVIDMTVIEKEIPWFTYVFYEPAKLLTPDNMKILRVPPDEIKDEAGNKLPNQGPGKSNAPTRTTGVATSSYDANNYFVVELAKTQTLPARILELEKETAMPYKCQYDTYEFANTMDFADYVYTNEYEDVAFVRDPSNLTNFKEIK